MSLSLQEIKSLLQTTQKEPLRRTPANFDKAAIFLLDLQPECLFEPVDASDPQHWQQRCKGCRTVVTMSTRKQHFDFHKREQEWD